MPHTVEEAYELADAAHAGDDAKLLDELGDVLFQVFFLSLLLEERGAGDLAAVADNCREKLIRRHPHVFGDAEAETAGEVLPQLGPDQVRDRGRREPSATCRDTLPSTLLAKKVQRRAGARRRRTAPELPDVATPPSCLRGAEGRDERFEAAGELLFAAVAVAAVEAGADPELALRAAADRYVKRVQEA